MNEIKQTHEAFVSEFKAKLAAKRDEFAALGIDMDNEDIGVTLYQLFMYANDNPTDEIVIPFIQTHRSIMGDLSCASPYVKSLRPMSISLCYKGVPISEHLFGADVYSDVYGTMWYLVKKLADQFLVTQATITKYLEGDPEARTELMRSFDFQNHRNWTIIHAKLDWMKLCFPRAYEQMMKDGEFMSVEEVEAKMKEGA